MSRSKLIRVMASVPVILGTGVAVSSSARFALAQEVDPKCYFVVCNGNVCVYQEIACPEPVKPVKP
jgi:hypothetical protein